MQASIDSSLQGIKDKQGELEEIMKTMEETQHPIPADESLVVIPHLGKIQLD